MLNDVYFGIVSPYISIKHICTQEIYTEDDEIKSYRAILAETGMAAN